MLMITNLLFTNIALLALWLRKNTLQEYSKKNIIISLRVRKICLLPFERKKCLILSEILQ